MLGLPSPGFNSQQAWNIPLQLQHFVDTPICGMKVQKAFQGWLALHLKEIEGLTVLNLRQGELKKLPPEITLLKNLKVLNTD
ncbi:hypothetical protein [Simkania sp.]|uniref:hypothetical protein n=1 Tax=Simkania sp. TaxID=34094 RepID=UPI003B52F4A9